MKKLKKLSLILLTAMFLICMVCSMAFNAMASGTANEVTVLSTDGTVYGNGEAKAVAHGGAIVDAPVSYLETTVKAAKNPASWDATGATGFSLDVSDWNKDGMWISYYLYISDVSGLNDNGCRTTFNDSENFWWQDGQIVSNITKAGWYLVKMPTKTANNTITEVAVIVSTSNKPDLYVTDINICDDGSVTAWSVTPVANYESQEPEPTPEVNELTIMSTDGTVYGNGEAKAVANGGAIVDAPVSYLETTVKAAKNPASWDATGATGFSLDVSDWNKDDMWISYYLYISDVSGLNDNGCRTTFNDSENFWWQDGQIVSNITTAGWYLVKMPTKTANNTITEVAVIVSTSNKPDLYVTDINICDDGSVTAWSVTPVANYDNGTDEPEPPVEGIETFEMSLFAPDGTIGEGNGNIPSNFADQGCEIVDFVVPDETTKKVLKFAPSWNAAGLENLSMDLTGFVKNSTALKISYWIYVADADALTNAAELQMIRDSADGEWEGESVFIHASISDGLVDGWNFVEVVNRIDTTLLNIGTLKWQFNVNSGMSTELYLYDVKIAYTEDANGVTITPQNAGTDDKPACNCCDSTCSDCICVAGSACDTNCTCGGENCNAGPIENEPLNVEILAKDGTIQGNGSLEWVPQGETFSDKVPTGLTGKSIAGVPGWGAVCIKGLNVDLTKCDTSKLVLSFYIYISGAENVINTENYISLNDTGASYFNEAVSSFVTGWNLVKLPVNTTATAINKINFQVNFTGVKPVIYIYNVTITDAGDVTTPTSTVIEEVEEEEIVLDLTPVSIIPAENPKAIGSFAASNSITEKVLPVGHTGKSMLLDASNNNSKGWFNFDDMETGINANDLGMSGKAAMSFWIYLSDLDNLHAIKFCIQKADPQTGNGQMEWNFWGLLEGADAEEMGYVEGWNFVTIKAVNLGNDTINWNIINKMYIYIEWKGNAARSCYLYDLKLTTTDQTDDVVIETQKAPELEVVANKTVEYTSNGIDLNELVTVTQNAASNYTLYFLYDDEVIEGGLFKPENVSETYNINVQLRADGFGVVLKSISLSVTAVEGGNDGGSGSDKGSDKGGCGSSVVATSALFAVLSFAGATIALKKKKD